MNKKDLVFTYILAFICIACGFTLHYPSPYHFPILIFILLFGYPFLLSKIGRESYIKWKSLDKSNIDNNKFMKIISFINNYPLITWYLFTTFFVILITFWNYSEGNKYINNETCDDCRVTTAKTMEKANEIQTFLAKYNVLTKYETMHNEDGKAIGYKIKLKNLVTRKDYYNAISELLDTSIVDSSVETPISSTFYKIKVGKIDINKHCRIRFKAYSPN